MKKLAIIFGCLFLVFIVAAATLPFIIDVDKYRPQIVKAVNDHINGEFKLGKLELSLWGGVEIKIESLSVKLKDAAKPFLETNSAYLEIPLFSLLRMSPSAIIVLDEPKVDLVRERDTKLNVMALIKEQPTSTPPTAAQGKPPMAISATMANASLGFRIEKGHISYLDEATGNKFILDGLEVKVKNLGLRETIVAAIDLPIKGATKQMLIDGVIHAHAKVTPVFGDGKVYSASGNIDVDATAISLDMNHGMVKKTNKVPMKLSMDFTGSKTNLKIEKLDLQFSEMKIDTKGVITLEPQMAVKLDIHSSQLQLDSLQAFVPMLTEYQLGGTAMLNVNVVGPTEHLGIRGELDIKGGKAAYPEKLKGPVAYDLKAQFTENSLHLGNFALTGPGLNADLKGTIQNFSAPQFDFALTSKEIDIDKLMKPPPAEKSASLWPTFKWLPEAEAATRKKNNRTATKTASAKKHDVSPAMPTGGSGNPMYALDKNPIIANASGTSTANISKLIAKGATISDISVKVVLKNMMLTIESATLKTFEGVLNSKLMANLKSPGLSFTTSGNLKGLNSKNAIATFVPKFKNTLEGKVNGNWSLSGALYPQSALLHMLAGTLNINAENGQLHTIDMEDSIRGLMSKVSFLQGKSPPSIDQGFKTMRADLKFSGGVIDANPLEVIGDSKGLNIKGKSKILENLTQDTYVDVFDPNHLLPKEISNGKDAVLQLHITGPLTAPQTDYGYTTTRLAKNVMRNQGSDLISNGIQRALGNKGGSQVGDAVKNALKNLSF